jgi:hypothetical protein
MLVEVRTLTYQTGESRAEALSLLQERHIERVPAQPTAPAPRAPNLLDLDALFSAGADFH